MRTRQHLHLCADLANLSRLAIVDAAVVLNHGLAHDGALDFVERLQHFALAAEEAWSRFSHFGEFCHYALLECVQRLATLLLFLDCKRLLDSLAGDCSERL